MQRRVHKCTTATGPSTAGWCACTARTAPAEAHLPGAEHVADTRVVRAQAEDHHQRGGALKRRLEHLGRMPDSISKIGCARNTNHGHLENALCSHALSCGQRHRIQSIRHRSCREVRELVLQDALQRYETRRDL